MNKLVSGAIGIEIKLIPGATRINLPDVVDLRKKRIKHIEFCSGGNCTKTPSGNNVVSTSVVGNLFLTLMEANTQTELIKSVPANELNANGNRLFINKIIDFQRSYIDLTAITDPSYITNKSVYLVVWYDEPAVWGYVHPVDRSSIQPLEITLTGLRTYFSENINLLNKQFSNLLLSFPAITPSGQSGMDVSRLTNKFITLQRNGLQFFSQVPLYMFYQSSLNYQLRLQNIQFDFQSSFIETLTTTSDDLKTVFFNAILDDNKR